ncbi:MAG: hypothetical protein WDN00_19500 [Limisphaerales bacterium]
MLTTYQECADKLAELLAAAQDAVHNSDKNAMRKAQEDLNGFVHICGSPIKWREMDDIASQAASAIFAAGINQALQELSSRTSDLASLTKEVNNVADHVNHASSTMRLDKANAVVDAASQALDVAKVLKAQLATAQPDQQMVAGSIGNLLDILQKVYSQAGDLKN